jgi:hypothetical protein
LQKVRNYYWIFAIGSYINRLIKAGILDKNQRIKEIEKRLIQIESEKYFLQRELNRLKCDSNESTNIMCGKSTRNSCPVTKEDKINLFISLFVCRRDVYPKLWKNKRKDKKGRESNKFSRKK